MTKTLFVAVVALVLVGVCFSTSHHGDGTYKLYIEDSVVSDNDFTVRVTNISYSHGLDVLTVDDVTYTIARSGTETETVTLEPQESYTAEADNGKHNVTITVEGLGYETASGNTVVIVPYAETKVKSYDAPEPDVDIESVGVNASYFSATVKWETDNDANGTVTLYDNESDLVTKLYDSSESESHTLTFHDLTSNTDYSVMVTACTDEWCVNSSKKKFTTLAVVPEITNVKTLAVGDTWANIYWETDVKADERVYYRKQGASAWTQAPPPDNPWDHMKDFIAYEPGVIDVPGPGGPDIDPWDELGTGQELGAIPIGESIPFEMPVGYGLETGAMAILPGDYKQFQVLALNRIGIVTAAGSYAVQSDILTQAPNEDILQWLLREEHQINMKDLDDQTTYEYMASSCADKCVNSSIYSFKTNRTPLMPTIELLSVKSVIQHGTSEVLYLRVSPNNPGTVISSFYLSWYDNGPKTLTPKLDGDSLTFVPFASSLTAEEAVVSITFETAALHTITVYAEDSSGMNATRNITVNVLKTKTACKNSGAIYYPNDTTCTNTWPYDAQGGIELNTGIDKCHASEVCDASLDYVLADAESCCNGIRAFSDEPTQNWGYTYNKTETCNRALTRTRVGGAMSTLNAESSMKTCKAAYLIYGLGSEAVYMKDYYTGEFCCSDSDSICPGLPHFTAAPWPESNIKFSGLKCVYTHVNLLVTSYNQRKKGWYASDTDYTQNSNSAVDIPPHSSINIMNTGTCVDYAFAVTTLLRKAGFAQSDIMTVSAPCHAYNLVWLPGMTQYSFIDTVGNSGGEMFGGPGWTWTCKDAAQSHCTFHTDRCSNDAGMFECPAKSYIEGC